MYKVLIEGQEFIVTQEDLKNLDVKFNKKENTYQILDEGRAHRVLQLEHSQNWKSQHLQINYLNIETTILDPLDQQVESMGLSELDEAKSKNIIAPMPGLILDIMCKEGDEVEEGTSLMILEAMKMENVIKAEGAGTISKINKSIGQSVDKGQLIIEIS